MLPSYTPSSATMQKHIHLGVVPFSGSPTGFGAHGEPPYTYDHVNRRTPVYEAIGDLSRAWDGTPSDHVLRTSTGSNSLVLFHVQFTLRVTAAELEELSQMVKRRVYLCDTLHCADNLDHTPFVKIMWFEDLKYEGQVDPMANENDITIAFRDMNTVTAL